MNAVATNPEWLHIVQQCEAQNGSVMGLPQLTDQLGRGRYFMQNSTSYPCRDGTILHTLYWIVARSRPYHRIGSFRLMADAKPIRPAPKTPVNPNDKVNTLCVGYDACGRKLVRVRTDNNALTFNVIAVEWETVRGVNLPRPVPVEFTEVQRR